MTKSIVVEYDLPSAPQKVWRTLTEPKLLSSWLMENDIKAEVGHRFTFHAPPMPNWNGLVECEVLAVEPLRLLRYSWRGGEGKNLLDSVVTWTLAPTAKGGTLLKLEHSGFSDTHAGFEFMDHGWRNKGARIAELAAGVD